MDIELRQFVVVPLNPRMSTGKVASQVAHSTFMALEKQKDKKLIKEWKNKGMCVIVLQCQNSVELMGIAKYLEQWRIPNHLYIDEGLTEVNMGTPTSLATGIMTEEQFWMLEKLDLFGTTPWMKFKKSVFE